MATGGDNHLKLSCMQKKSQNKRALTLENYKYRWFALYTDTLKYYEGNPEKWKEKGSIYLNQIKVVASVENRALDNSKDNVFQIVYKEGQDTRVLYVVANSDIEAEEWIRTLIEASLKRKSVFSKTYHPGAWTKSSGKYSCCHLDGREARGCQDFLTNKGTESSIPTSTDMPTTTARYNIGNQSSSRAPVCPQVNGSGSSLPSNPPPPVPAASKKSDTKVYVAVYDFAGLESGDLQLKKDLEYEILDNTNEHWWKARDIATGKTGYIPSNYVKRKNHLETYEWYQCDLSRSRCEELLKKDGRIGTFLVRDSVSQPGLYTLSLYTGETDFLIRHYHIKKTSEGKYFIADKHLFDSVQKLIHYHSMNAADKWEVDPVELEMKGLLGAGHFGSVYRARWRGSIDVAVKLLKEGTMSEENFIDEAKTMKQIQHANLVQLYGVSTRKRPLLIVTEFMPHGSLHSYLKRHKTLMNKPGRLLEMCIQICKGMTYLEQKNVIHRDLASRNCLVGHEGIVKVADFGLARFVLDDEYVSSNGTKFPVKWAPPEVLSYTKFSTKSDVWAFGVLMWEIFTGADMPYESMPNADVVDYVVTRGKRLKRPRACPETVYKIMMECWHKNAEDRPPFTELEVKLMQLSDNGDYAS